jgi:glycosyltransferase involved in cell wall biosynthesis
MLAPAQVETFDARRMPAVSVLMVFHRDTPFLRPAIASVLQQTVREFELILVDNGTGVSTDDLGAAGRDERLRWIRLNRNEGIACGHNAGVAAARADVIALIDHDDLMVPDRLERQLTSLRERPDLGLVGSGAAVIDETDRKMGNEFCLTDPASHRSYSEYYSGAITPSFTGRAEVFRAFPYRPQFRWAADFDFVARVVERHEVAAIPRILLHYRRHAGQTTVERRVEQVLEECYVRLLTARRRSGSKEDFAEVVLELQGRPSPPANEHAVHREFSERFLREGFATQAVYQARRMVATRRDPRSISTAVQTLARAMMRQPARTLQLLRIFFQGPVRALGLRDEGPRLNE